ncbi:endonuclease domain-containing protein, partial [Legionella moravica]
MLRQRARDLRNNSTDAERHLWYYLRANRFGFKFKRQVQIGEYLVDFVCLEKRLIIEFDGGQHMDNQIYDMKAINIVSLISPKKFTMLISPNIIGN